MPGKADDAHQLETPPVVAKPRLRWTRQLHQHFVNAVSELGGPDKATPKAVMRVMGIPGITLYHLKSHLQKYRLAKSNDHLASDKTEDATAKDHCPTDSVIPCFNNHKTQPQLDNNNRRSMVQVQMEVQRKLQEQIEVQRHLQLRIEAQGKYLQSVLRKAQETISGYSMNSIELHAARAELSELVSAAETECPSPWISQANSASISKQIVDADCSTDSCLTSSERANGKQGLKLEGSDCSHNWRAESRETGACSESCDNKISDGDGKESTEIDLNRQLF